MKDVNFVPKNVQNNMLTPKTLENLFNAFCELFLLLHFWLHKCFIYPTFRKIWIFPKQAKAKSLIKPNELISKKVNVMTLGSNMPLLPNSGHNKNFP